MRRAPGFEGVAWDAAETVEVTTLDRLIADHGLPRFVKIDVEGAEAEVLAGLSHAVAWIAFESLPASPRGDRGLPRPARRARPLPLQPRRRRARRLRPRPLARPRRHRRDARRPRRRRPPGRRLRPPRCRLTAAAPRPPLLAAALHRAAAAAGAGGGARLPRRFPLELPLVLLLIAGAPAAARAPLRAGVAAALAALLALALLDLATAAALGRRFNPVLDLPLVAAGWRLVARQRRRRARRRRRGGDRRRARPRRRGALVGDRPAARPRRGRCSSRWRCRPSRWPQPTPGAPSTRREAPRRPASPGSTCATAGGRAATSPASAPRPPPTPGPRRPPTRILPALAGRDVFLVFVESYGRSAHENPLYAPTVTATLGDAEARLAAAGLEARSAWLTSPVVGGQSWLAHATLLSGLAIDNEGRYRALLASPRRSLLHLAAGRRLAHRGGDAGDHPALARGRLVRLRHRARGQRTSATAAGRSTG